MGFEHNFTATIDELVYQIYGKNNDYSDEIKSIVDLIVKQLVGEVKISKDPSILNQVKTKRVPVIKRTKDVESSKSIKGLQMDKIEIN